MEMPPEPREITGLEPRTGDGSPLEALIGFYQAFNSGDLNALAGNWLGGTRPSMDNPIGGIRRGWPAIRAGYGKLEKGLCCVDGTCLELRIRTTRWFVKTRHGWRQLHHHGSIEEPAQLADYQRAVLGSPLGQDEHA